MRETGVVLTKKLSKTESSNKKWAYLAHIDCKKAPIALSKNLFGLDSYPIIVGYLASYNGTYLNYDILISTSTPAGRFKLVSESMVLGVASRISIIRLWTLISNCSRLSL